MSKRLNKKDLELLLNPGVFSKSGFGIDKNDYIEFHVYDEENNHLQSTRTSYSILDNDEKILKPGNDLRELGYYHGKFKINYNFFKLRGGSYLPILISRNRIPYVVEGKEYPVLGEDFYVADSGRIFKKRPISPTPGIEIGGNDFTYDGLPKDELFIEDDKYWIHTISPSRKEIRVAALDINEIPTAHLGYHETFKKIAEEFIVWDSDIDDESSIIEPDVDNDDQSKLVAENNVFESKMVSGIITVKNAFITDYESVGKELIPTYGDFVTKIIEIISPNRIRVKDAFDETAERVNDVAGKYKGTIPRKPKTFSIKYEWQNKKELTTLLNFDNNQNILVTNWEYDDRETLLIPSIVYKLYEPLPIDIQLKDRFYVVSEFLEPIDETVTIVPFVDEEVDAVVLRAPDFNQIQEDIKRRETSFETQENILTTDSDVSKQLSDKYLSQSLDSIDLNVDYSLYDNFIVFGSAEQRLKNFKYKLGLIESHTNSSASLLTTSGSTKDVTRYENKIRTLKNEFDSYEKYLYYESSSYYSGSIKLGTTLYDSSWPKTNSTKPYTLSFVTSSEAATWYTGQLSTASLYDKNNTDSLILNLPHHIAEDENNSDFLLFLKLVGHHFDDVRLYIKHLPNIHDRESSLTKGMSSDIITDVAKSLGLTLYDGKDLISLPRYELGQYLSGSTYTEYSTTPEKDISREIWKRIVNNLPYFLKNKGTIKSLEGIIACYGIPTTILRVREYGGPDPDNQTTPSYRITRKFTKAIDFKGAQYVQTGWTTDTVSSRKPDTVEFRFKAATGSNQVLVEAKDATYSYWALRLLDNDSVDNIGRVQFRLSGSNGYQQISSSAFPVYDGEFYSVMLKREDYTGSAVIDDAGTHDTTYKLFVKKYDSGRSKIYLESAVSMSISGSMGTPSQSYNHAYSSGSTVYIGGAPATSHGAQLGTTTGASSSLMEFRLWNSPLSASKFDNHVAAPKTYNGNHVSASYTDLVLRFAFDDNTNHGSGLTNAKDVRDSSADQSTIQTGSAEAFANETNYSSVEDESKMVIPKIGANREMSNKVRIENNSIDKNRLSPKRSREISSQEFAPIDTNKVGVYFAPTDVINEDIIQSLADFNYNEYIGDPRDQYEQTYRGLNTIRDSYWQKYTGPNNFWDYLRLITYYDQSMFDQMKKFIPARAKTTFGTVIEPNILERPKVVFSKAPDAVNVYYEGLINVSATNADVYSTLTSSYDYYTGTITNLGFRYPSLYRHEGNVKSEWETTYATASTGFGGLDHLDAVFPFISSSRLSEHNYTTKFYYTSSADAFVRNYTSSSYARSEYDTRYIEHRSLWNTFYNGCLQTKDTTIDANKYNNKSPAFEGIDVLNPRLVVQEPGESRLKIE